MCVYVCVCRVWDLSVHTYVCVCVHMCSIYVICLCLSVVHACVLGMSIVGCQGLGCHLMVSIIYSDSIRSRE